MIKKHLALLGFQAKDRITGFTGVISSVSYDLYGCVCAVLTPGLDKDGKQQDGHWYDVKRLDITSSERVMPAPNFDEPEIGAAEKPLR